MDNVKQIIKVIVIAGVFTFVGRFSYEQLRPAPSEMTKEQYLNLVVKNCDDEIGVELCTCFYTRMLNEKGVKATMKFDVESARNPDAEFDDYTLNVLEGCL